MYSTKILSGNKGICGPFCPSSCARILCNEKKNEHALNAILAEAPLCEAIIYNNTELGGAICVVSHAGEVKFNQVTLIPRKEFQNKSCNLLYTFGAHLQTYMPS